MKVRTVSVITGSRADYGLLKPVMVEVRRRMTLQVVVTGMHLEPAVGNTYMEIERDGFTIDRRVANIVSGDNPMATAKSIGVGVLGITDALVSLAPDIVLVLGDRSEAFAAAIAASFSGFVLGHIHGGDSPQGGYDEYSRHAITKLAHLHFAATATSSQRILNLGESSTNVHVVGAPGLDSILAGDLPTTTELAGRYGLPTDRFILFVLHPISTDSDTAAGELRAALDGTLSANLPVLAIFPNADAGGGAMRAALAAYGDKVRVEPNLPHRDYLGLLRDCAVLVGNSSSGIIEAPSFRAPVVNVGLRQGGRERADNVLDVAADRDAIAAAIRTALEDPAFRTRLRAVKNPYGDGHAAQRIVDVLESVELSRNLQRKKLTY